MAFAVYPGPYPDPDLVMGYLLQIDLQAMMLEEGLTAQISTARPASPAVSVDRHGANQSQERNNNNTRTNYNNQSASEGRNVGGSNSRQSRLPPKRKDPESEFTCPQAIVVQLLLMLNLTPCLTSSPA